MRFVLTQEVKKSRIVRVRISEALAERYQAAADDAGLDIGVVLRQALEFAAEEGETTEKNRKRTKKGME